MFLTSKMEMFERKKLRINEKPKNPLNSRKTQEKRALFGFKGAGKVSKQKALSGKVEKKINAT